MAKVLSYKDRVLLKFLERRIKKTLKKYNKEFKDIMETNGIKTDHRVPLFLVYFIYEITGQNQKPKKILQELDEKGVLMDYKKLSDIINVNNSDFSNISAHDAANQFTAAIINFIDKKNTDIDSIKLRDLIENIVNLIQITNNAIPIEKNDFIQKDDIFGKINNTIHATKAFVDVQKLLLDIAPQYASFLFILINNITKELFK